jgi:GntR family transcriptional regulator/MocR family aminotransferase
VRSLASQLAVARGTVEMAYATLAAEGYIQARGAAGTIVTADLASLRTVRRAPASEVDAGNVLSQRLRRDSASVSAALRPFQLGLPALDAFPVPVWSRLAARCARQWPTSALIHQETFGYRPLREAIAGYLAIGRGIACSADHVIITGGYQATLGLISRALLHPGDAVWLEDPGYFLARNSLMAAGTRSISVPVDSQGIDVPSGIARSREARLAVVTPSHQAPLGVALTLPRRLALLAWAYETGAWILEDDYDGEFRYNSRPLPALKSLDTRGRVLYAGTFSKVLFPGLRLGYLVVPDELVELLRRLLCLFYLDATRLVPAIVTEFMTAGHFARHIRRMRQLYAERREALANSLARRLEGVMRVELQAGGMHLIGWLKSSAGDLALARLANGAGLAVSALSTWRIHQPGDPALLMSFTNIPVNEARSASERLARAIT